MKGLSQQNMADELEITVAAYSNIERGVTDISVTRLFQISAILDVTPQNIITLTDHSTYRFEDIENNYADAGNIELFKNQLTQMHEKLFLLEQKIEQLEFELRSQNKKAE